jgi:hypothetical protein
MHLRADLHKTRDSIAQLQVPTQLPWRKLLAYANGSAQDSELRDSRAAAAATISAATYYERRASGS